MPLTSLWYAYECLDYDCAARSAAMLDLRINGEWQERKMYCPLCGNPMNYSGYWEAEERGYGSRGDVVGEKWTEEGRERVKP